MAFVNLSSPQAVFDRIAAVHWSDWQTANRHEHSRSRLLAEYMRRAALWARDTGGTRSWPFYDIAANVAPTVTTDPALAARLDEYLEQNVGWSGTERVCGYALRFAGLRETPGVEIPDLPDPFEPLLVLYERGGEVVLDELGGALIGDRYVHAATWREHVSTDPVVSLDPAVLDALDLEAS